MSPETHSQLANFIWSICNLLRGPYKRNEYRTSLITAAVTGKIDVRGTASAAAPAPAAASA